MLTSLVDASALAYLPAGSGVIEAGTPIEVHYLPGR
jgi:hypothetical protein